MKKVKDSFQKHPVPVLGNAETGTIFDAFVRYHDGKLRMDLSWRPQKALAVSFSDDGLRWSDPVITLRHDPDSGWEDDLNRNCVLPSPDGNGFLMWYTGQANGHSYIGVARSEDGIHFERFREAPILSPEADFEGESVMNPFVMHEDGIFKMWYAAGETYEPNVICYAESSDGVSWKKYEGNPIFCCNPEKEYEQNRIGACDVLRDEKGYLMFYIGYRDIHTACICAARSENGIDHWRRVKENPLVTPTPGTWDEDACYKPTVVKNADGTYRLWYNGRRRDDEYIGYAHGRIE
ncbi:MAG: hypothetical protein J6B09_00285 [Clostridia bacterium]|nr:hypothetical protein [Clostridia bacterium]